jgi:hypothetical protein
MIKQHHSLLAVAACRGNGCVGNLEMIHNSVHSTVGGLLGELG